MAVFAWKYLLVMFILKIVDTEDSKHNEFPHEMKCMDAACKGIISQAWTKDTFETDERHMLSFKKSELVEVQGKPTDPNNRLWLCKIFHSGERGFISEDVLKEILVFEHVPPEVVLRDDAYHEIKQTTSESTLEGTGDQVQENPGNQEIPEVVVIPLDQADANPAGDAGEEKKDDVHLPDNEGHKPSAQTFEDSLKQVEPNPGFEEEPQQTDPTPAASENNQQSPSAEIDPDKINSQEEIGREEEVKSSTEEEKQPEEGQDSSQDNLAEETSVSQKEGDGKISPEENVPSVAENLTPTDQLDVQESENLKDFLDQLAAINEEYDSGIEEDLDEEEAASDEKKEEIDVDSEEVIGDGQDSSTVPDKAFTDKFQNLNPDEIQPTPQYEVIDGTTIYFDDDDSDFTFDQGNVNVPGDQLQPSPSVSSNQGASATPPLPVDALRKDEKETEEDEDTFLSNTDDLALANIKFAQWLTVPGSIDILFDELAAGDEAKRQNQALIRQEFNIMMNDPEWKRQIMKKMWHHFGEDDSVKDMFGSYDGDDEMGTDVEEEPPLEEDPYDPSNVLRKETSEGTDVPDETVVIVDPYNFNSLGGEDANKEEEEEATDYDQEKKMEDEWLQEDLEKTEDTTQTPQLQTDYPPSPPADYPNLPEGFPSYTEAPETEESSARNFSVFMDEMAEMVHTNMDALYHVLSDAVVPLVAMLPDEMKEVIKQPTFFGIAWTTLVWFQIGITSSLFLLFCGCVCTTLEARVQRNACCARRNKVHQRELMMEIKMITEQKAKALDALKTTTKHFSDQNTEYFNYQQLTKNVEKEKEELKTMYEELKEEKKKQDDKYADLENMNIQLQEELDSFKEKVEHHGNANDKAKNQIQKMQKKINELETKLKSHRDDALSQRQDIESLNKENKDLSQVKAQLSGAEVNASHYAEGQAPLGPSADSLLLTSDVKEHAAKLAALTENVAELETENKTLKETVSDKDNEIEVLKDCLVQLKGLEDYGEGTEVDNEARIQQLLDVNRANAKITLLEDERKAMEEKIGEESRKIHNLEDDNRTLRKEVEALQQECKKAKEDHEEARTKLDVLTEYFKGKEVEMQRKLGKEEALKFHSQKELDSLGEKTAAAEAEISNYKQQIQDLKDEIEKSERSFRQQIAAHEKKAHESWMLSRTAERKLKETNKEVASLRQRLTELQGRKTTDASPLIKPSPERMGSPSNASESSMLRRDQPSRNSILEDAPSPPMIGGQRQSPSEKERPPSRPVRVSRSGRPPSFHEDFFPPEDMMPPPDAMPFRGPPGGFHPGMDPYGPPPPIDGYMPPEMDFDGPPGPPPPDMGYGPPGPYDFGPRGPPPPSMGGDPRFPPPFMGPHPDDFPPDGPYGAMDPGMGPPPPFRGPPPDWNDRVPHPSMGGPPPPGGDPRTSRPVSRGGPVPSHIPPDQAPRSSTPVESGEPQNQGMQNQIRRTSYVQP